MVGGGTLVSNILRLPQQGHSFVGSLPNQHGAIDVFERRLRGSRGKIKLSPAQIRGRVRGLSWIALY